MYLSSLVRIPSRPTLRRLLSGHEEGGKHSSNSSNHASKQEGGEDGNDDEDYGPEDPADIFTAALGNMFPDDAQNMHGDPGAAVIYRSGAFPAVEEGVVLRLADPVAEDGRRLFAHYLWNASLLVAELVGWGLRRRKKKGSVEENAGGGGDDDRKSAQEDEEIAQGGSDGDGALTKKGYILEEGRDGEPNRIVKFGERARAWNWSVEDESVVELGAGTGLAGIACSLSKARQVCITDYPADEILANIRANVRRNCIGKKVEVLGHQWGNFLSLDGEAGRFHSRFSRVIAADCLWLEAQHESLARSIAYFLDTGNPDARAWVVAGFHTGRPKVTAFFDEVERQGELTIEDMWEVDTGLNEREWDREREEGIGERKKWLVVAILKWRG